MSTIEEVAFAGGSAKMGVYTRDHCPPHATFRDLAKRWTVRITFSFRDGGTALLSIIPARHGPSRAVINELEQALLRRLPECRRLWWGYHQNNPHMKAEGPCCLNNQQHAGAVIVSAVYDPNACHTRIALNDGSVITLPV